MKNFLLVEDSPTIVKIVRHLSKLDPQLNCEVATSFADTKALLSKNGPEHYFAAVVDLHLPDAPNGEVVDFVIEQGIPSIVMTGNFDDDIREQMQKKAIVDYIIKESRFSYEYALKQVKRIEQNKAIKVLVVDDSKMSRKHISSLLKMQMFQVLEAEDGEQGLALIQADPSIDLVITDYNMPNMNGFELVKAIRKDPSYNELMIIGLSGEGDSQLSTKFIKNGANDFLSKPFSREEFNCRILHTIETMEHMRTMKHMAYHDYATGLPNKRKFFEQGKTLLKDAHKQGRTVSLGLISIDQVHELQDSYGLEVTEVLLHNLAQLLRTAFGRFEYARIGDADIAILMPGLDQVKAFKLLDGLRAIVEDHIAMFDERSVNFTISGGLYSSDSNSLMELLREADNSRHIAQQEGGNQIAS